MVSRAVQDGLDEHRLRCSSRELKEKTADKARVRRCITHHCGVEAHVIVYRHDVGAVEDDGTCSSVEPAQSTHTCAVSRVRRFHHQMAAEGSPGAAAISRQSRRALQTPVRLSSLGAILGRQSGEVHLQS